MPGDVSILVIRNRLPGMSAALQRALAGHVRATAEEISTDGKRRCPVRTGALRAGIHADMTGPTSAIVATSPQTPYDVAVHEGTGRMAPRPFLRQAAEAERPKWDAGLRQVLGTL